MAKVKKPQADFEEDEIAYYYSLLQEELTEYDCGTLCKEENDGIPFCCLVENAVPILYKKEFKLLKSRSKLWKAWKPKTKHDKKMFEEHDGGDTIFCECKGIAHCERENRSISCRTFPLEPYIDTRGVLVGLVFMREFTHGCPLTKKAKDIRQPFIDNHFLFWEKLLLRKEDEYELYLKSSRGYRISRGKTGKKFKILYPSHLQNKKYLKKYI